VCRASGMCSSRRPGAALARSSHAGGARGAGARARGRGAPVGAAMHTRLPMARQSLTMVRVVNVLPQPGPPVSTSTGAALACATAARWPSLRRTSARARAAVGQHCIASHAVLITRRTAFPVLALRGRGVQAKHSG